MTHPESSKELFAYERINTPQGELDHHFRVFDTRTDTRIATCYLEANAISVRDALNGSAHEPPAGAEPADEPGRAAVHCALVHADNRSYSESIDALALKRLAEEVRRLRALVTPPPSDVVTRLYEAACAACIHHEEELASLPTAIATLNEACLEYQRTVLTKSPRRCPEGPHTGDQCMTVPGE